MQSQAQKIFKHFGEESQRLIAQEEWLELQIALMELAKHDIKHKRGCFDKDIIIDTIHDRINLVDNCNEELADNILLRMQLEEETFEYSYGYLVQGMFNSYELLINHCLENFSFDKAKVRKTVQEKIDRTIKKYGIGD